MTLAISIIEGIRDELLSDDIPIDYEVMKSWDELRVRRFFEAGGLVPVDEVVLEENVVLGASTDESDSDDDGDADDSDDGPGANSDESHYHTLMVPRNASAAQVRKAYRKLAVKWHPDKNLDDRKYAERRFKAIAEAYEILSDPEKRSTYDRFGKAGLSDNGRYDAAGGASSQAAMQQAMAIFEQMMAMRAHGVPGSGACGLGNGMGGGYGMGSGGMEAVLEQMMASMMGAGGAGHQAGSVLRPVRSASEYARLLHTLRSECAAEGEPCAASALSPPPHAQEQWSQGELRAFFSSAGKWRPLVERTQCGALLHKLGWRTRLDRARGPTPLAVMQLEGGAMAAAEGRPAHFATTALALAADGFVAINFGVAGRYEGFPLWSEARDECAACRRAMPIASADSPTAELHATFAQLGGPQLAQQCPVLHGLRVSLTNFALGLRAALADSPLGLLLSSYTDTKLSCLPVIPPGRHARGPSQPRFDRDGPVAAGGVERRVDPSDGCSYTRDEFEAFYQGSGEPRWASAKAPTGAEDRRRLSAMLFLSDDQEDGGEVTIFAFDDASETFTKHVLAPRADTLLLFRADRILYEVAPARRKERFTLSIHFLGYYV